MESDSQVLVSSVNKESFDNSYVGLIVKDYKRLFDVLQCCSLAHVRRSINKVTHYVAKAYR